MVGKDMINKDSIVYVVCPHYSKMQQIVYLRHNIYL